jgi:hypothetical protein
MVDRQLVTKATDWVPEPFWVMPACRTPKPDSDPPGPLLETHRTVRLLLCGQVVLEVGEDGAGYLVQVGGVGQ